jgi:hypothetical protein
LSTDNGDRYVGEFLNDEKHGYGEYTVGGNRSIINCPGCKTYKGYYKEGLKSGFGRCYSPSGVLLYEGQFFNNLPIGHYPNRR